ncbi:MAG: SiaB family protein kinase [Cyclobacteriaceae bacterium]|nr:SiaB family protein kinase [Cyclobacteriaceae bacterium]
MQSHLNRSPSFEDSEILLSYRGTVTDELFDTILELAEHKLDQEQTSKQVKRKVFKVLVESLQNVYHHFDDLPLTTESFPVTFTLEKDKLTYCISTGNHILITKVEELRNLIEDVNNMDRKQLKSFYRNRLGDGSFSERGGAGLGIVDIIRKSGEKITYDFRRVNEDYSYFSLKVKVSA